MTNLPLRAIVLQHMDREGPGTLADVLGKRDIGIEILRLDQGVAVPRRLNPGELLMVMGGSMGVGDIGDARYPFLAAEADLLRSVLANRQPVLGVCLGAQLLAHAAGARVYPNQRPGVDGRLRTQREVGFGEVILLDRDREKVLAGLPPRLPVLHWHGDTFDLPAGAVHLAKSDLCAHQAFRIGDVAFGLQFHVETTADLVRSWAEEDAEFARSALGPDGPARIVAHAEEGARQVCEAGQRLVDNILDQMLARHP